MKVKNVIKGYLAQFKIEELNIISEEKVIFSGALESWKFTDVDMILYKKKVENMEVIRSMLFKDRKIFIFVQEKECTENEG